MYRTAGKNSFNSLSKAISKLWILIQMHIFINTIKRIGQKFVSFVRYFNIVLNFRYLIYFYIFVYSFAHFEIFYKCIKIRSSVIRLVLRETIIPRNFVFFSFVLIANIIIVYISFVSWNILRQ